MHDLNSKLVRAHSCFYSSFQKAGISTKKLMGREIDILFFEPAKRKEIFRDLAEICYGLHGKPC